MISFVLYVNTAKDTWVLTQDEKVIYESNQAPAALLYTLQGLVDESFTIEVESDADIKIKELLNE